MTFAFEASINSARFNVRLLIANKKNHPRHPKIFSYLPPSHSNFLSHILSTFDHLARSMLAPRVNKYFVVFFSSLCSRRARVDTTTSVTEKFPRRSRDTWIRRRLFLTAASSSSFFLYSGSCDAKQRIV